MTDAGTEPTTVNGLELLLGEGAAQPQPVTAVATPATQPLDDAAIQPILDRMPDLQAEAGDVEEFKLPPQSLPPPTASTIVTQSFPPPDSGQSAPEVVSRPAGGAALCTRGRNPDRALSQRDLQPAHGAAEHARRTGRRRRAGQGDAGAAGRLEVARHADALL